MRSGHGVAGAWVSAAILGLLASLAIIAPLASAAPPLSASILYVNDDAGAGANVDCARPFSNTIAAAVAAANPGDTIHVCAGTYEERLVLSTNGLSLVGDGAGLTTIRPRDGTPATTPGGRALVALLLVTGASGVTLRDLTLDGSAFSGIVCPPSLFGILYLRADGGVRSAHITGIAGGTSCSAGIGAITDGLADFAIVDNVIDHYMDTGIRCTGRRLTCTITGNRITGRGPVSDALSGGIIVTNGALAEIRGNTITDHYFIPRGDIFDYVAVGIALFNVDPATNPHLLEQNTFAGNELNVQRYSTEEARH